MANDADWVADVKRWVNAGAQTTAIDLSASTLSDHDELGYEAAHPALQAAHWPDAPRFGIDSVF